MLQALRERRQDDRGFTLIELMIVVLIIGILIAVGLPTFLGARERAQDRAAQALLRTGMAAAKTFYTDANTYEDLTAGTPSNIESIEQSIVWTLDGTDPGADPGPVAVAVSGTNTTVTLVTKSGSGDFFCLKDISGAASGNGVFYGRGTSAAAAVTACVDETAVEGWVAA